MIWPLIRLDSISVCAKPTRRFQVHVGNRYQFGVYDNLNRIRHEHVVIAERLSSSTSNQNIKTYVRFGKSSLTVMPRSYAYITHQQSEDDSGKSFSGASGRCKRRRPWEKILRFRRDLARNVPYSPVIGCAPLRGRPPLGYGSLATRVSRANGKKSRKEEEKKITILQYSEYARTRDFKVR